MPEEGYDENGGWPEKKRRPRQGNGGHTSGYALHQQLVQLDYIFKRDYSNWTRCIHKSTRGGESN